AMSNRAYAIDHDRHHRRLPVPALQHREHHEILPATGRPRPRGEPMKKLALTAVLAVGLSQATGCIITSDDTNPPGGPRITANIRLSNAGPNNLICVDDPQDPRGQDGLRINARVHGTQDVGFSDVYNCTVTA